MPKLNLKTPRQIAQDSGWSEKRIRKLIENREIRHLELEGRYLLPSDAVEEFIKNNMFEPAGQAQT